MTDETELCHRCHVRPGKERFYLPNGMRFSLAGAQMKLSMKRTAACDECWEPFVEYQRALNAGEIEPDPAYHG